MADQPEPMIEPDLVFVDLYGTLISESSEKLFLLHLLEEGVLSRAGFLEQLLAYAIHPLRTLRFGKGWNRTYLKRLSPELVKDLCTQIGKEVLTGMIRPRTLDAVGQLARRGAAKVLLTSSLRCLARPVAEAAGITDVRASEPEVREGRFTGALLGVRPWGRNKLDIAKAASAEYGTDLSRCAGLGDSWSDRHLLSACGLAVAVHPDRRLARLAKESRWLVIEGEHTRWA